ncbi:hypothetical protein JB92DRAFT_3114127 [Gautieria morchelliformis]|nr:hypothetical protein JB92DRAFT_3114127 [Gautieria morchelliformis]
MLGFDSAGPKSKVVKGKKKKTSKAENPVIQDITGSNENSNKHKRPAADVENLELPASLFIAKRAKLAVKGTSQTMLAAKGIPQSKKAMVHGRVHIAYLVHHYFSQLANKQKVPKASSSTALSCICLSIAVFVCTKMIAVLLDCLVVISVSTPWVSSPIIDTASLSTKDPSVKIGFQALISCISEHSECPNNLCK